jgi:hypothetical protein
MIGSGIRLEFIWNRAGILLDLDNFFYFVLNPKICTE